MRIVSTGWLFASRSFERAVALYNMTLLHILRVERENI
jgi:hypothetical protein